MEKDGNTLVSTPLTTSPPPPHFFHPFCSKYDPTSNDAMTFKHYNAKQVVMGRVSAPLPPSLLFCLPPTRPH